MIVLIFFAFLAGIVTILSPCILPILPIVLSGSVTGGKRRPLGIITGFVLSFTFFTLFLSTIVKATGLQADVLRQISVVVLLAFGISMILPKFQAWMESVFSKLSGLLPRQSGNEHGSDFIGGILVGLSLGLLWAPCVGPILASVISLAFTGAVTASAVVITLAYSLGTAIPMLAITYGGRELLNKVPWLSANTQKIQKIFGVFMIVTALAIFNNWDRQFQTYILEKFPNYGVGLTKFEDNAAVKQELDKLNKKPIDESQRGQPMNVLQDAFLGNAPEFIAGGEWINSKPLTMQGLRGKVVLVDFWTYTCINCIRTLPYLKDWWATYKDKGLVIVGVHTPEFAFEHETKNVEKAAKDFGLTYPIMQDNDFATWNAYANHYWPAKYLVDKNGKIRYTHFGEGDYDKTESMIQTLLAETGVTITEKPNNPSYTVHSRTPELYLGYARMQYLASAETVRNDTESTYSAPAQLRANTFAFSGPWTIGAERAMPKKGSSLILHFDAAEVFLVMRPKEEGATGTIRISLDGQPLAAGDAGEDTKNGQAIITADRLYKLIKLPAPGAHILKLEFLDDNGELYAFTFG